MRVRKLVWLLGALASLATSAQADRIAAEEPVLDPVLSLSPDYFWYRRASAVVTPEAGRTRFHIDFPDYQSAIGRYVVAPMDWSQYDYISFRVTNNDANRYIRINLVIQPSSNPTNYAGAINSQFSVGQGQTKLIVMPFKVINPRDYGLRRIPPLLSESFSEVSTGNKNYDFTNVFHWRFSYQETFAGSVDISDFRLLKYDPSMNMLSDRYGQFTDRSWSDKVAVDNQIVDAQAVEASDLLTNPGIGEHNGSLRLTREARSSNWRMQLRHGKWFMVHPSGRLFWSLGLNGVTDYNSTVVQDRESMFENLPDQAGPNADFYAIRETNNGPKLTYNFYKQNLKIKYGESFFDSFVETTKNRLRSWGFNTVGSWSHQNFNDGSMPFVMFTSTADFPTRLACPYVHVNDLPDPFAPDFRSYVETQCASVFGPHVNKSNFMGVMVDNELSWGWGTTNDLRYNLALGAMRAPQSQPARSELRRQVRNKYSTIEALNAAWNTGYASWSDFATNTTFTPTYTASQITDFQAFCKSYAAAYYGKVRASLNAIGFRGLYLGSRFYPYTPEVLAGGSKFVHAYTINVYGTASQIDWSALATFPRPVVLSEFSFGLQADGNLGGPAEVTSTSERGTRIVDFVTMALQQRNIVGIHWFEYVDHPVTGRFADGENYGIGLVDITDQPHPEIVNAFRTVTANMYRLRRGY